MESKKTELKYVKKIKEHLNNPPKTCEEYDEFYWWFEYNQPTTDEEITTFVLDVLDIAEEEEPWIDIKYFLPLDNKLRNLLKKYNYLD